ncbi:MAG TPA: hypothetical protein VGB99_02225 [Acidobacteriota bacterium]
MLLGLNLWAIGFLAVALVLGWLGHPAHVRFGVFAAGFATLAQSLIFALFMGTAKLIKRHVALYRLPHELIEQLNAILRRLFPLAYLGAVWYVVAGVLGAMQGSGWIGAKIHGWLAAVGVPLLMALVALEYRQLRRNHELLLRMESLIPVAAGTAPAQPPYPGDDPDGKIEITRDKVRALAWIVGVMGWLPLLSVSFVRMAWARDLVPATLAVCIPSLILALLLRRRWR